MFIVVEGIDDSGKTYQSKRIAEKYGFKWRAFPDRTTPIGKLIDGHLKKQWCAATVDIENELLIHGSDEALKIDALMFQAIQFSNRMELAAQMEVEAKAGLVCDRYWQSGYAYGGLDGLDKAWLKETQHFFLQPDLNILIDTDPVEAMRRRKESGKKVERYEDLDKAKALRSNYIELWNMNPNSAQWAVVDGSGDAFVVEKRFEKLLIERTQKAFLEVSMYERGRKYIRCHLCGVSDVEDQVQPSKSKPGKFRHIDINSDSRCGRWQEQAAKEGRDIDEPADKQ